MSECDEIAILLIKRCNLQGPVSMQEANTIVNLYLRGESFAIRSMVAESIFWTLKDG